MAAAPIPLSAQTFVITVNAVNDTPSFTIGADQTVNEDAGAQTVVGFATGVLGRTGRRGRAGGRLHRQQQQQRAVSSVQPTIDAAGNLTYTPAANANGSATVTVQIHDNGGGADTSAAQTFVINVNAGERHAELHGRCGPDGQRGRRRADGRTALPPAVSAGPAERGRADGRTSSSATTTTRCSRCSRRSMRRAI